MSDDLFGPFGDTPGPDPRFVDRLDASLRVAHASGRSVVRSPWRGRSAVLGFVALLVAVAATLALVVRDEAPSAAFVITDATNVTVFLPDGTSVADPADGYALVDGAVVEVGVGGMVTIDEVILDSPVRVAVRDGLLVTDTIATTTSVDDPPALTDVVTTTTATDHAATTSTTVPPTSTPELTDRPTTTRAPADDRDRGGGDGDGRRADDREHLADEPPPDPNPEPEPGETAGPIELSLRVRPADAGFRVTWGAFGLDDGWTVVVVRLVGEPDGGDLDQPGVTTVAEHAGDGNGEVVDAPPADVGPVRYRVFVLDEAGGVVASSAPQRVRR